MDTNTRPIHMLPAMDSLQIQTHTQTESEGIENIFHVNENNKNLGVAILISNKIDFKTKAITKMKINYYSQ